MADCPACGKPMTSGGVALVCGRGGGAELPLPDYCADPQCRKARDEAAIKKAIEVGVIDP